jgi:hypothetical protein
MINLLDYIDAAIFLLPMLLAASTLTLVTYKFMRRSSSLRRHLCERPAPAARSARLIQPKSWQSIHIGNLPPLCGLHIALWPLNYRRQPMDGGVSAQPAAEGVERPARGRWQHHFWIDDYGQASRRA